MNLKIDEITFVIVSYKSESIIHDCLNTLPKEAKKIIVENSGDINLKKELITKYDNIEVILSKNVGMGAGNNIGLKACRTKYAYVLNPDTKLYKNTLKNLFNGLSSVKDFTLASALNDNPKYPNYKIFKLQDNDILSVDSIDGFSMLFNLSKFSENNFFDENFFLYLENDDLCLRIKKKGELIYIIKDSLINHTGNISKIKNLEYLRNWHWMWSKYYFNKKHFGSLRAVWLISFNFISGVLKFLFFILIFNFKKSKIYKYRLLGIISSISGKKSYLRPDDF